MKKLILILLAAITIDLSAQVSLTDSVSNLKSCFQAERMKLTFTGTTGTSASTRYVEIGLPAGQEFRGLVSTTGATGNYVGVQTNGFHRIELTGGANNATITVVFLQFANCGAGVSSWNANDSIVYNDGASNTSFSGTIFNGVVPDLSITNISKTPSTATVGTNVTRTFTVTNGGFGPTSNFIVVDRSSNGSGNYTISTSSFKINPSGINFSIPTSKIATVGDSTIIYFDPSLIQQIADLDTEFENGESFVLEYQFVVNTCAVHTISTQLLTAWRCPSDSRCKWYEVNDGFSTYGPALPNIVLAQRLIRKNDCFDGTTIWKDTLVLRNNSTGAATNIVMDAGGTRTTQFYPYFAGAYFDTASFFYKIGKNGVLIKPAYTVQGVLGGTYSPCSFNGLPNHIRFTVPYLGPGDSLFILMGQVQCNYASDCIANQAFIQTRYFNGQGVNFTYKNACGNATLNGGWIDAVTYRDLSVDGSNSGPLSIVDGQAGNLSLDLNYLNRHTGQSLIYGNRAFREVVITLPSVIVYDPAYAQPVYFTHPTNGNLLPYYRSANGDTFKFRIDNNFISIGTKFNARVLGQCDGVTCSGILFYKIQFLHNPDTTYCSNLNPEICLDYPIAWGTSCVPTCCPKGMVNLKYSIDRINYGLGDSNNDGLPDGTLDKSLINTKRALPGDTIEIVHKFYLKTDSVDTQWDYVRSIMQVSNTAHYSVISDSVFVDRISGTDSIFNLTPSVSGGNQYITDISSMPPFLQGDTVTVRLKLKIINNPVANLVSFNTEVAGGASNDNFSTSYSCGSIVDKLEFFGIDNFAYGTGSYIANGCQQIAQTVYNYTRIGGAGDRYNNYKFPYEYRPSVKINNMHVLIPNGFTVDSVEWAGSNSASSSAYPNGMNLPFVIDGDTLEFRTGQLYLSEGGNFTPPDEGAVLYFRVWMTPSCATISGVSSQMRVSDSVEKIILLHQQSYPHTTPHPGAAIQNFHPNLIYSAAIPVANAYTPHVSWPLLVNNLTPFAATDNWIYFESLDGLIILDSLKQGATTILPDSNGFFRIGSVAAGGTNSFTVYGSNLSCNYDSLLVHTGWSCGGVYPTSFNDSICVTTPLVLYVQPQPASIQTQIQALTNTPSNPFDASSAVYGSSEVTMCNSFPVEMEIQSTQPGDIYDVIEECVMPFNGGAAGLDLLSDSITIEYPIGTAPRLTSWQGRSLMSSTISTGTMTVNLQLLDTANFGNNEGLPGTGLGNNNTRRAIIRWKMKTNCNIASGDQWSANQHANQACGSPAHGDDELVAGFSIDIAGVAKPYSVSTGLIPHVGGCSSGNCDTTDIIITKIGAAVAANDSIYIKVPTTVNFGNVICEGSNCPGGATGIISTATIVNRIVDGKRVLTFPVPTEFDANADQITLKVLAYSDKSAGCKNNVLMEAGVRLPAVLVCNGTPCPASNASLGSQSSSFNVEKPIISLNNYNGLSIYPWNGPNYNYYYDVEIDNAGNISTDSNLTLLTFFDVNGNSMYDAGIDSLADTYVYAPSIADNAAVTVARTFMAPTFPSPSRPMFTVVDTSGANNCMCNAQALSSFATALSSNLIGFKVLSNNCKNIVTWQINGITKHSIYKLQYSLNGIDWKTINTYDFTEDKNEWVEVQEHAITLAAYYRLVETLSNKKEQTLKVLFKKNPCNDFDNWVYIYPNPTQNDHFNVVLTNDFEGATELQLVNTQGQVVANKTISVTGTTASLKWGTTGLSKGVYFLKVSNNKQQKVIRIIVE